MYEGAYPTQQPSRQLLRKSEPRTSTGKVLQLEYVAARCPHKALYIEEAHFAGVALIAQVQENTTTEKHQGTVKGQLVSDIMLDSRCTHSLVQVELLPASTKIVGDVFVHYVHGDLT